MANELNASVAATESRRLRWLRGDTTPDRFRLIALVSVFAILAAGTTAWFLTDRLVNQTNEVATSTGEVLIATQQVRASFAEADAAAVSVHLAGADGNREQRRLFEQAMDRATTSLERVSRLVGDDEPSHEALQEIAADATEYAGLIEAARLASIEDISGADATLRQASALNRNAVSPAVETIAARARSRFTSQIRSGWYSIAVMVLIVALMVLIAAQYLLAKRFRRVLNVPLALASFLLILLVFLSARGFSDQQTALSNAQSQAFDAIEVSEEIQQTAYLHRAIGTSSVLTGQVSDQLFDLERVLYETPGLLEEATLAASSDRERAAAVAIEVWWTRYVAESSEIQSQLRAGNTAEAERIAQGSANAMFNGFNTSVEAALLDNREQFLDQLQLASESLRWLRGWIFVGALIAVLLTWWGFSLRLEEYR